MSSRQLHYSADCFTADVLIADVKKIAAFSKKFGTLLTQLILYYVNFLLTACLHLC